MRRLRLQIGLRLMLLLMAFSCVLSAYYRAATDLRRENMKAQLMSLEGRQFHLHSTGNGDYSPQRPARIKAVDDEVAALKKALGE